MSPEEKLQIRQELLSFQEELTGEVIKDTIRPSIKSGGLIKLVNTIDDIYYYLGCTKPELINYTFLPEYKRERALYEQYLVDMIELFNEGWKPDFTKTGQKKYYVWFDKSSGGWAIYDVLNHADSGSRYGSGWYYKDEATAKHCSKKFLDIYQKALA